MVGQVSVFVGERLSVRSRILKHILLGAALTIAAVAACSGSDETVVPDDAGASDSGEAGAVAEASIDGATDCPPIADDALPPDLRCSRLYESWQQKTIAADVRAYAPATPFYSDGAEKLRFIRLPFGQKIDTTDIDAWEFPVGTMAWKEFRLLGRRVETRLLKKVRAGKGMSAWAAAVYRWSGDGEASATAIVDGERNAVGTYEIPAVNACGFCHSGGHDMLLGVSAVSLAAPGATGLSLAGLASENAITSIPPRLVYDVPDDPSGSAAPALAYLHINCGVSCHNPRTGTGAFTGLWFDLSAASLAGDLDAGVEGGADATIDAAMDAAADASGDASADAMADAGSDTRRFATHAYQTAVGQAIRSPAYSAEASAGYLRVLPKDRQKSLVHRVMNVTTPGQMPPVFRHVVDTSGRDAIGAWIDSL